MTTSPLTNTRAGSFHKLELLNSSGVFQDLLALIAAGGISTLTAAGGGITVSGTGATRVLTVDLSAKLESLVAGSGVTITGSGTSRTISAAGGGGTILQLGGATQSGATTLNFVGAVGALVGSVLSITAQPLVTSSTDLALQDATLRNIQAQTAILLLRDSAGATALEIQASLIGLYKSTNMHETVNFYKAISLTNTASSLTNQLYVGSGNTLIWGGQQMPDLPTIQD